MDRSRSPLADTCLQDFRCALRILQRNPGFGAVAITALAVGISANVLVFSAASTLPVQVAPDQQSRPRRAVFGWVLEHFSGDDALVCGRLREKVLVRVLGFVQFV